MKGVSNLEISRATTSSQRVPDAHPARSVKNTCSSTPTVITTHGIPIAGLCVSTPSRLGYATRGPTQRAPESCPGSRQNRHVVRQPTPCAGTGRRHGEPIRSRM
ncbi:hypothetical protein BV898_19836 [Hypsibius exemplaris]|uniref:Uncharacterized protein n=1 Tax=Hypsibius exemplaris TaxID=2072580 RepID=A0A9X6NSU7_HYPEX|nr:hypothetical protein BV898_19836 [Hypsibius exemplaris]